MLVDNGKVDIVMEKSFGAYEELGEKAGSRRYRDGSFTLYGIAFRGAEGKNGSMDQKDDACRESAGCWRKIRFSIRRFYFVYRRQGI
ncbi:MAG: hypothetical protein V8R41_04295 [Dorea formicigenerans]